MEELETRSIQKQIVNDLKSSEFINNLFSDVTVQEAYSFRTDDINLPMIVVQEILNEENRKYTTPEGEQATDLAYNITVMCETTELKNGEILSPIDSTKLLMLQVDKLLGGEKYQMNRAVRTPIMPQKEDNSVMMYQQIYDTVLYKDTLYRK